MIRLVVISPSQASECETEVGRPTHGTPSFSWQTNRSLPCDDSLLIDSRISREAFYDTLLALLGSLYQVGTGHPASFRFATGIGAVVGLIYAFPRGFRR